MIKIRKSNERGHGNYGWLDTYHTFSFDQYHDPDYMGFRSLRVINEDKVEAGKGFGTHPHRDMEIITYVLAGSVQHKDSMGNGSIIRPGEVQRMTAGTGVTHSESNPSKTEELHLLQIWILPEKKGLEPGYEQKAFGEGVRLNKLCLAASSHPREGSVTIHQDVDLWVTLLEKGKKLEHRLTKNRHAWIQIAQGKAGVNSQTLGQGDGAAVSSEASVTLTAEDRSEILLFDLA